MSENIKDVFVTLAKYNAMANKDAVKVLEGLESSKLTEDLGSYFGSILGLLNHQLASDIGWLKMLGENVSELDFILPLLEEFEIERLPPKEIHWKTLSEYNSVRIKVDEVLERMVTTLSPEQYLTEFTIEGRRGKFTTIVWRNLLLLFNHHIHHRGGVSLLLDQLGIENNFSSLLARA
ncbi:MAG: DinB family protein [Promethearchaeota archaeon]